MEFLQVHLSAGLSPTTLKP